MTFVKRDSNGNITALSKAQENECDEKLDINHPEIAEFLLSEQAQIDDQIMLALKKTDNELARVTEDLIQLLISKQLIMFTELPQAVQDKVLEREKMRSNLQQTPPGIMDDEGSI